MGASDCGLGASRFGFRRPCGTHDLVLMGFQGLRPWLISWVPVGRSIAEPSKCGIGEGLGSGGLGVMGLFRGKRDIFAADGTRMERGRMNRPTGRRDADRCGRDARAPLFSSGCGVLRTVTKGHKEGGEGGRLGRGRKKGISLGRRGTPVLRTVAIPQTVGVQCVTKCLDLPHAVVV